MLAFGIDPPSHPHDRGVVASRSCGKRDGSPFQTRRLIKGILKPGSPKRTRDSNPSLAERLIITDTARAQVRDCWSHMIFVDQIAIPGPGSHGIITVDIPRSDLTIRRDGMRPPGIQEALETAPPPRIAYPLA